MDVNIKYHIQFRRCFFFVVITICIFPIVLATGEAKSQKFKCPFKYLYYFGDGASDTGNSIRLNSFLPAASLPYGKTFPGQPTGRWSDGRIELDYTAGYLGMPKNIPYLALNGPTKDSGVVFAVARSPVLEPSFFEARNIQIPPYVAPLTLQFNWFKTYLKSICPTPQECAERLKKSLLVMGDHESNDIGYALVQGKSIDEVATYVPIIVNAVMNITREMIKMGATRIVIPGSTPLGCSPYILTALNNSDASAYDNLGCLKSINSLILSKNAAIQSEIGRLSLEFPTTQIGFADTYLGVITVLQQDFFSGNLTLKACCGIGGKYNYDSSTFCGSQGVPVCPNPNQYIYWDGLHYTQETYFRYLQPLVAPTLLALKCISI